MQSLAFQLCMDDDIKLNITTRYNGKFVSILNEQQTTYFLVPDKRNLLQKRIDILLNREPLEHYLKEYLKVIEQVRPDIIHVFGTELDYGLICGFTDIPVVIHIQGILHPYCYQLGKIHISLVRKLFSQKIVDYIKGTTIGNSMRIFKRRVGVEEKIFNVCRYFIGRTNWDKNITSLLAPRANYYHCEEVLRQGFFNAEWYGNKSKILSIVSTISNPFYKGHETIMATCLLLKKVGVNFVWHIIGLDEKTKAFNVFYKKHMSILLGNIQLHGMLAPSKIIEVLQHSNVYVHPSHIENSSNALCEAMAIGMPVIALHVGGNASIVNHGEDGLLVSDNDPYSLAAAIKDLVKDTDKSQRMATNARIRASMRHDPKRIVARLKEIYINVIERHENKQ